ncbi:MAG: hypothetical protein BZY88_11650 [SAR202 cluster bacterium Io17-Chloro-G9]|nr:MAG: hypothetical protein BZY88_11650 [SAR202 cluster bacterium Io17-Chloro-G9]
MKHSSVGPQSVSNFSIDPEGPTPRPQSARSAASGFPGWGAAPIVTWGLLATNALVWFAASTDGDTRDPQVLIDFGAMFGPLIIGGEYWRLFTAMFLHAGLAHLVMNGLGLLIVGRLVEKSFGHLRFLLVYLLAGLFGSVASFGLNSVAVGAGASGAIFGTLGALAAFFAVHRDTFGNTGRQSLVGVLMVAGLVLASGLQTEEVDNWAHLGGFLAGFLIGLAISPRYRAVAGSSGLHRTLVDTTSLASRWWVAPAVVAFLVLGTWAASARLPEPAYPHTALAESHYREGDSARALAEADEAISLERTAARAYYIRGLIRLDQGNVPGAVSDLTDAIRYSGFNDGTTKREAISLLVKINARRQRHGTSTK